MLLIHIYLGTVLENTKHDLIYCTYVLIMYVRVKLVLILLTTILINTELVRHIYSIVLFLL